MELWDCNCWYGVPKSPPLAPAETVDVLLEEIARAGVHRALVRNAALWEESPQVGNALVSEECAGEERLLASWAILPPQTGEAGTVDEFVAAMHEADVRALWAYPEKHRYVLNATTMGGLFEEMTDRAIPLFIERSEVGGGALYALVDSVLRDFPALHLCVVGHGSWGEDRYFRPLMERYPNFMVDTSRYELDGGIEEICRGYGPERLLFGTKFPETPMGGPILTLLHADISDEDRTLIAGGNLRRILEGVRL
ncbi:MAG: amidohydrolase family protein [Armatimonadota bacterium]